MRLALLSDTHQEFLRDRDASTNPLTRFDMAEHVPAAADVIVVAGDIDVSLSNSLRRLAAELPGRQVIYTPGNHDLWNDGSSSPLTMDEMLEDGRRLADEFGIHLLIDRSIEIDGVRFLGSTLWTDFMIGRGFLESKVREAAGKNGMQDYRYMRRWSTKHPGGRRKMTPEVTIAAHKASRAFIEATLATPFPGQTVVVTHHAPHKTSLDPQYSGAMDYCYASDLSLLLESDAAPDLWLHGHIHRAKDYHVGRTRIVSNPRGYVWHDGTDNGFDAGLIIELDGYNPKPPGM